MTQSKPRLEGDWFMYLTDNNLAWCQFSPPVISLVTDSDFQEQFPNPTGREHPKIVARETVAPVARETVAPVASETVAPVASETVAPVAPETVAPPPPVGHYLLGVVPLVPVAKVIVLGGTIDFLQSRVTHFSVYHYVYTKYFASTKKTTILEAPQTNQKVTCIIGDPPQVTSPPPPSVF